MVPRIQFEQWAPVPIENAFLFFAHPAHLPRIRPPRAGTELTELRLVPPPTVPAHPPVILHGESLAGVGSEIVAWFRLFPFLPFRARWVARITEFRSNHHFADIQKAGPFKRFEHCHMFSVEMRNGMSGTVIRDVIEHEVGFGVLGHLAHKVFIRPSLQSTFEYRQRMLETLLA
jgi:ligand-binding SRPBCC domain-containing protein